MTRKVLLGLLTLVFAAQSVWFANRMRAGFLEVGAQRAWLRNDLVGAWERVGEARRLGAPAARLERRRIEILVAGFNQRDVGVKIPLPLADGAAEAEARRLVGRRLREAPYLAHLWSLAAELAFHDARVRRRGSPIDLSSLSEDPMENLLPFDRIGLAALEKAASLEPDNYLYHDLLAEQLLEFGSEAHAAPECRRAVASFPRLTAHHYLDRTDLPGPVVQAALDGFQDALLSVSLVARVEILRDAARLLSRHGRDEEAVRFLELASRLDPGYYDAANDLAGAHMRLGQWQEAEKDLEMAIPLLPDYAPHYVLLARVKRRLGDAEGAIEAYRRARLLGATDTRVFVEQGEVLESLQRGPEARRQFLAAVNLNPTDDAAWTGLLGYARRNDDRAEARRACDHLMRSRDAPESVRRDCAEDRR